MRDPRPVLDELRDEYGPIVGLGAGPLRLAIVGDPVALRELFGMPVESFRWGHRFNVLGFVVGNASLIVSDGPDWVRRRSSVRAGFSRRRLNGWVDTIVQCTDAHVDRLLADAQHGGGTVDLSTFGRGVVQEIVVRTLFGPGLAARTAEIAARFQRAQDYLESPFWRQVPHPFPCGRRGRVRADLRALRALVDERMASLRAEASGDPRDMLEALLVDGSLSDDEIRDQVVTLVGAGLDTTSASLAWMLWCTALAGRDLWQRLRAEADEVLVGDRPFDDTHFARLAVAQRTMREATRLHPAGSISPRLAHEELTVGGYRIRKRTLVMWSAYLAGRDREAWTNPLVFDSDRFVDPTPEQKARADLAWVPFGRGSRNCIGFALAQMELTLILARLAQRIEMDPIGRTMPKAVGMVVNRPAGGVPMRVRARRSHP